jgi:ABC-type multidrug transport system fused ATPase/permease subunit
MIMMVYAKALTRKNFSGKPTKTKDLTENGTTSPKNEPTKGKSWTSWIPWVNREREKEPEDPASMGKVMNLIRGDVYEVAQRFWEIPVLLQIPLGIIIAAWLTWSLLGPSCFLAVFSVLIAQGITAYLTRYQIFWMNRRKIARDERLQVSSQFIEVIRHLRWYGWQTHWLENVLKVRQKELWVRVVLHLWFILINIVNAFSILMFPVIALATYTLLDGHELRVDIIFPALQIFNIMTSNLQEIPNLINTLGNAYVASSRIQKFMDEPEKPRNEVDSTESSEITLTLDNCSFCWPETTKTILENVNLTAQGGLTVVIGKVGSGKTALLQSLLGEMDMKSGLTKIPNLTVGYCSQTPWLQSMTIRDNILFFNRYDPSRYRDVLDACELLTDMVSFKNGDLSFIGENGIGLSGGQKARVALARAVYCDSQILLLDDPISALDHSTAELIVKKLFGGSLLKDRTVVLVTHRHDLVSHLASQTLRVNDDGTVTKVETTAVVNGETERTSDADEAADQNQPLEEQNGVAEKFIEEEHRADAGVQARVYW